MDIGINTAWAYAERAITAPLGRIRSELVRLIGQAKFSIKTDQLTLVEAARGSKMAGGTRAEDRIPVELTIRLSANDSQAMFQIQLADSWVFPSRRPIEVYHRLFRDLLDDIDQALRRIDPAAGEFAPAQFSVHPDAVEAGPSAGRITQAATRFMEASSQTAPRGWRDYGDVVLASPRAIAVLPIETAYGMVTVGTLVASKPGAMPPNLVAQVEKFTGILEHFLQQTAYQEMTVWLEIEESAHPVVEFLVQQARIREEVPLRTLQICVTCRLAKVVNPDYRNLRNRRHRFNVLSGSVGAFISPRGISPFVLIGRLAQLNQLDPEFVCPRCQGMHAESSPITSCTRCGQQCDDSALRVCGRCKFDYRSLARTRDLWQDPPPLTAPHPPALSPNGPEHLQGSWHPPVAGTEYAGPVSPEYAASADAEPKVSAFDSWPAPVTSGPGASSPGMDEWPAPQVPANTWAAPDPGSAAAAISADGMTSWGEAGSAFAGWYPDPFGRHESRWWDGFAWTEHVTTGGVPASDPVPS